MSAFDELLHHVLTAHQAPPHRPAFELDGRTLTWPELERRSRAWAARVRALGVEPGDRVAVRARTSLELIVALVGHHRAGVVHVPINTRYQQREVAHILEDSGAKLLACDPGEVLGGHVPRLELTQANSAGDAAPPPDDAGDESTAMLIYTSGTTGRSKGVALPFRAVAAGIGALTRLWRFDATDTLVLALPLFHVHGLCIGVHGTLIHGMRTLLQPRFEPRGVVDGIAAGGTVFMGVPTMYRRLLDHLEAHPEDADALRPARLFTSGSAALPARDFAQFEALTGHRILERYGMTETLLTLSNPYEGERRPGTVGRPVPGGAEVRVVTEDGADVAPGETGEIAVRGVSLMTGYFGLPEATAAAFRDGWFMSGDAATVDADGYVRIVGRKSVDIIKSGGFKISAREIEDVLLEHPDVAEVAVVGLPDAEWGERIAAAVVPAVWADTETLAARLTEHAAAHLADFKKPRAWQVASELPRNALGKVQKHRIVAGWGR